MPNNSDYQAKPRGGYKPVPAGRMHGSAKDTETAKDKAQDAMDNKMGSGPGGGSSLVRGNQGDMRSGMEKAMSDHADAVHPVQSKSVTRRLSMGTQPSYSQVQDKQGSGKAPRKG